MTNDELKQALRDHVSVKIDVNASHGVYVSLCWDDEPLIVTPNVGFEPPKIREQDDLIRLWAATNKS